MILTLDTLPQPTYSPSMTYTLPPHLGQHPIVGLDDDQIGRGWRRVAIGEVVKTHYETWLLLPHPHWALGAFFTSDGYRNKGVTHYRAPSSVRAYLSVALPCARKWWARLTQKTPSA